MVKFLLVAVFVVLVAYELGEQRKQITDLQHDLSVWRSAAQSGERTVTLGPGEVGFMCGHDNRVWVCQPLESK